MKDIAPDLQKAIEQDFENNVKRSKTIVELKKKLNAGMATFEEADRFAVEIGEALKAAFSKNLSSAALPDGKLYYNIASRIIPPALRASHAETANYAQKTQKMLNEKAKVGIKAMRSPYNTSREKGLIEYVCKAEQYDGIKNSFEQDLINFNQAVVTDTLTRNAELHYQSGIGPVIRRIARGSCCKWCAALQGTYNYDTVRNTGNDVFRRHRACRCVITYDPGDGRRQNAHTKKWQTSEEIAAIEKRMRIGDYKYENVTPRYYDAAAPGTGTIKYSEAYSRAKHANEVEMAQLLHREFGGDIVLLKESESPGVKTPDFLWNEKYWELKTVTTEKAADSAIRSGLKQIKENPGGVILDYRERKVSIEEVERIMDSRMRRGTPGDTDIMVIRKGSEIRVYRYRK